MVPVRARFSTTTPDNRLDNEVIEDGKVPVRSRLSRTSQPTRLDSEPIELGIVPVRSSESSVSVDRRLDRDPIELGNVPTRFMSKRYTCCVMSRNPSVVGILPVMAATEALPVPSIETVGMFRHHCATQSLNGVGNVQRDVSFVHFSHHAVVT